MKRSSDTGTTRLQYAGESPRVFTFGSMKPGDEDNFDGDHAKLLLALKDESGAHMFVEPEKSRSVGKASSSKQDESTSKED